MRGKALSFFGMGYVGPTSALCFASKGFRVVCFDVDTQRAELIASERAPSTSPASRSC